VVFLVFTFTLAERSPLTRIRRQFVIETVRQLTRIALGTVLGLTTLVTVSAAPATPNPTRTPPAPAPDPLVRNAFRPTHTMLRGLLQVQVNRDGSSTEISETLVRIETEAGV
jgi:hypothetical protein